VISFGGKHLYILCFLFIFLRLEDAMVNKVTHNEA